MGVNISEQIRNAIRSKGLTMDEAAQKLEIGKTQLYLRIANAGSDKAFQMLVHERLGINLAAPERNSHSVAVAERTIDDVVMKYHTIPLPSEKIGEAWLPKRLTKADITAVRKWLDLIESNLTL